MDGPNPEILIPRLRKDLAALRFPAEERLDQAVGTKLRHDRLEASAHSSVLDVLEQGEESN